MKTPKAFTFVFAVVSILMFLPQAAQADWDPGDPHKMHFPQLPDYDGWDVEGLAGEDLADDWLCTGTGPVEDIHIWFSEETDQPPDLVGVEIIISNNNPDYHGQGYGAPNEMLWFGRLIDNDFSISTRQVGTGAQGWFDPESQNYSPPPHHYNVYQLNITDFRNPFIQQQGTTYWLQVQFGGFQKYFGWKTADLDAYPQPYTGSHFTDVAVYRDENSDWYELTDPITSQTMDLAFVITPEPAALGLLLIGGLAMLTRRRPA